jgi:hypothetical protein
LFIDVSQMDKQFTDSIQAMKDRAKQNLEEHGFLQPVIMFCKRDGSAELGAFDMPESPEQKDYLAEKFTNMLQSGKYKFYIFISEATMSKVDTLDFADSYKAQMKKDVIVIRYQTDTGEGGIDIIPFTKQGTNIIIHDENTTQKIEKISGRFDFWR